MPTRKIAEVKRPCSHPEHDPPNMMVFTDGLWEHICPACGHRQVFRVSNPTLSTGEVKWTSRGGGGCARFGSGGTLPDQTGKLVRVEDLIFEDWR